MDRVKRAAIFLDRDGVLNIKPPAHEYVGTVEQFTWLPGAVEGAARLAAAGYVLTVVSNQRGIARGLVSPETLTGIEAVIQRGLGSQGAHVEAFRYCPHELDAGCGCRKPRPGMILSLAEDLELELGQSWLVGDAPTDIEAGRAAGVRTLLITEDGQPALPLPDLTARSLLEASEQILGSGGLSAPLRSGLTPPRG